MLRALAHSLVVVFLLIAPRTAFADAAPHGKISLVTDSGAAPLVLELHEGAFRAEFTVANNGDDPLFVSRVAPRGDDTDVRSPPKLSAKFTESNSPSTTIPPHGSKRVSVTWSPDHDGRMTQLFGEIVVTSTDDAAGEVALGVSAQTPTAAPQITQHVLSWILALPLLGLALIAAMKLLRFGSDQIARRVAIGSTAASAGLALWAFRTFDGSVTRADGNDGFQLIERASWIRPLHVEYFVGVDGLSIGMVLVASAIAFLGLLASAGSGEKTKGYYAAYLVLAVSITGLFIALDLVLFYAFWCAMFLAAYRLVASSEHGEIAAPKLGFVGLLASALLLFAIAGLYQHSDHTFLADGTSVAHSFAVPELMHVSYNNPDATLLGFSLVKVLWVSLFVPFMLLAGIAPLHTWLVDVVGDAPAPVGALVGAVAVEVGIYGILRFNFGILPEATRWAAGALVGLGVASIVYGALCAFAQDDLKKFVAYASVSHAGVALLGIGSLTPEGIAGASVEMTAHAISIAALLLAVGAIEERARTRSISALSGVAREMPLLGSALVVSLAASFGVPGLFGFWGECLATVGAYPSHRLAACAAALAFALVAAAHVRVLDKIAFGKLDESWQKSPYLEPFGGKFPDLGSSELSAIAPLVVLVVLLGLWPAPILTTISGAVRDTNALVNPPGPDQIALL